MRRLVGLALAAWLGAGAAFAGETGDWLPPRVEKGAVQQLESRLEAMGWDGDAERRLEGAREVVGALRETLEDWSLEGVLRRAPSFEDLGLPKVEAPLLDAMARYHTCNLLLAVELQDPELAGDPDVKMSSVLGLSAFTLAVVYLRDPFLAEGGSEEQIASLLGGEPMEPVLSRLQADEAARRRAEHECQPAAEALLARATSRLEALSGSKD